MQRFISSITLFIFFIWILPLGAFIDPSVEQKVCGGQRAICLCSHHLAKQESDDHGTINISNPSVNKEAASAGGASHNFLLSSFYHQPNLPVSSFSKHEQSFLNLLFTKEVEHVPKT